MARIRTIKPEFFTSEDIVSLSPVARLLYIGLWCEADREGRLMWKPGTLKLRYLPGEQDDFAAAAAALMERKHVVLYGPGDAYCHLPTFLVHQRPNPREAKSILPPPPVDAVDNSTSDYPQLHAANLDRHMSEGREGKEGKGREGASTPVDNSTTSKPSNGAWWKTPDGIRAKGEELGMKPHRGEEPNVYKQRLFDHLKSNGKAPLEITAASQIQRYTCAYCSAEAVSQVNGFHHCRQHSDLAFDAIKPGTTPKFADAGEKAA